LTLANKDNDGGGGVTVITLGTLVRWADVVTAGYNIAYLITLAFLLLKQT